MATTNTYTVGEICTKALRLVGIVSNTLPVQADDLAQAIMSLDMMLKTFQLEGVFRYTRTTQSITVTNATISYTLSPRLHELTFVTWKDASGNERELIAMTDDEYRDLPDKDSAGEATQYYYDRQKESAVLYVWPVLATAASQTIEISGSREVEDVTAASETIDIPTEWAETVTYGLASRLADEFELDSPAVQRVIARAGALEARALAWDREDTVEFRPEYYD